MANLRSNPEGKEMRESIEYHYEVEGATTNTRLIIQAKPVGQIPELNIRCVCNKCILVYLPLIIHQRALPELHFYEINKDHR